MGGERRDRERNNNQISLETPRNNLWSDLTMEQKIYIHSSIHTHRHTKACHSQSQTRKKHTYTYAHSHTHTHTYTNQIYKWHDALEPLVFSEYWQVTSTPPSDSGTLRLQVEFLPKTLVFALSIPLSLLHFQFALVFQSCLAFLRPKTSVVFYGQAGSRPYPC